MKRTAAALLILTGLCGGGCLSASKSPTGHFGQVTKTREVPNVVGPYGEPITAMPKTLAYPEGQTEGYQPRGSMSTTDSNIKLTSGGSKSKCKSCGGMGCLSCSSGYGNGFGPNSVASRPYGILPVPQMGPWGAVAAIGHMPANGGMGGPNKGMPSGLRTSIKFEEPADMKVTWLGPNGFDGVPLTTPGRYNFPQGHIYRLKMTGIPRNPELSLYPTLEVYNATQKSLTFLAHSSVPVNFTEEDFAQVAAGNFLVKVVYLPDDEYQDLALAGGAGEIVSSQLEPGADPLIEAERRGTILLVIRMGNINLELQNSPAMNAPPHLMHGQPIGVIPAPVNGPINGGLPLGVVPSPLPNGNGNGVIPSPLPNGTGSLLPSSPYNNLTPRSNPLPNANVVPLPKNPNPNGNRPIFNPTSR